MSRNGIPTQLNASLIREVRMIAQQFFRSRENTGFWNGYHGKTSATPEAPALKCARCVGLKRRGQTKVNDAITLFEGTALCEDHL